MLTQERIIWLQKNKERGEIAKAVKSMNPKGLVRGITYSEALSIINGKLVGVWGEKFADELERIIKRRQNKTQKQIAKYSKIS